MDTQWLPTRIDVDLKAVTHAGVVGRPFGAVTTPSTMNGPGGVALAGSFGVFFAGTLEARFYDKGGARLGSRRIQDVIPTERVAVAQTVQAPADTARVSLHLIDRLGSDRRPSGEVAVSVPPRHEQP